MMETQTLAQWCEAEGVAPIAKTWGNDGGVVLLDEWATPPPALWHLSDYFVSSVGAGVIWLLPVEG